VRWVRDLLYVQYVYLQVTQELGIGRCTSTVQEDVNVNGSGIFGFSGFGECDMGGFT